MTWPSLRTEIRGEKLIAQGTLQPSALGVAYLVRFEYVLGGVPVASVLSPKLSPRAAGEAIPHVYPGPRPCLWLPSSGEWTGKKLLSTTVVPWLLLWLMYYELWHATGEWLGGGEHPQASKQP